MTDLYRCTVLYTGGPGMPGTNTLYASAGDQPLPGVLSNINDFIDQWADNHMTNAITATVLAAADIIDSTTGQVTGNESSGSDTAHPGGAGGDRVPLNSQLLCQLRTGFFVSGRELRGRIFLPGAVEAESDAGRPSSALISGQVSNLESAFSDTLAVYSPTHHTWATISSCSVWSEWAVLRSRRD